MAKRNPGRRGRSRKRRSNAQAAPEVASAPRAPSRPVARGAQRNPGRLAELKAQGERPPAPWHPWPLSELLIFVGAIGVLVGLARHVSLDGPGRLGGPGAATLVAGVVAVVLGTIEVSLREHRSGFRSHTLMLSLLPAIALYTVLALGIAAFTTVPRWLNIPLVLLAGALFTVLYRVLRATFVDARRERTFSGGR
jgi:hypothetical protein